jgi:hypothetical protein
LVVGVLESCSDAEATWRRRCDEAELGKTGEVVRRNVSRTRPLAAPGHVVMAISLMISNGLMNNMKNGISLRVTLISSNGNIGI